MLTKAFPVRGYAESTISAEVGLFDPELTFTDPELADMQADSAILVASWRPDSRTLKVTQATAQAIARALNALSNLEDEIACRVGVHPEQARMARAASLGLGNLYRKVLVWLDAIKALPKT